MSSMTKGCWYHFPNFSPEEFKCGCGKCSRKDRTVDMDCDLLYILQKIREKFGPVQITCGYRCQKYNDSLTGSVKNSYHVKKKAADFYVSKCDTLEGRREVMKYIKSLPNYKYTYCNENGNHPNMGNVIHVEVK